MKYFAVLFLAGLAAAAINDDFLNEHAHQFLSTRGTVTDKDDAFDNLDKIELVRTFSFCMRNYKMVGLDSTAQCLAKSWRNSKATPLLMKDFLKRIQSQAAGADVDFELTISDDATIDHSAGKDITWTATGTVTVVGGKSAPYTRKGQLHLGQGSVTFAEDITSSGTDYDFEATTGVHVDWSSVKDSQGDTFTEAVISASQAAGFKGQQADGSTIEAEHVGQATIHSHAELVKNDNLIQIAASGSVSSVNQDSVHVHKSDGTVTHQHSFGSDGSNVLEAINVTLGTGSAKVSAAAVFQGRGAHAADAPDFRYEVEGVAKKTVDITQDSATFTIVSHDEASVAADVSDYNDKALASVASESSADNTATVTVDISKMSLAAKGDGKFSGKVVITPSGGNADTTVTEDGTFSGSITVKDNGDGTATGHGDGDLKVNIHTE